MNKNVIIDITSYIRHLTKMVIKVSLAMILAVEMLSGSITGEMCIRDRDNRWKISIIQKVIKKP